ncbi:MAG: diguanylate cyclase [Sideroxydans sp.]|nr:diguanylate cyclase [Sideroxydans sp.]
MTNVRDTESGVGENAQRYERLLQYVPAGVCVWRFHADGAMGFEYVSPPLCEMLGLEAEDLLRDCTLIFSAAHPDEAEDLIRANSHARTTLNPFRWEGRFIVHGQIRWLRISSDPAPLADGGSLWSGVFNDITESKRVEDALRQQKQFADDIINSLPGIFYMLDVDRRFVRVNRQFLTVTGYAQGELDCMTAGDFFEGEDSVLIAQKTQEVFVRGGSSAEAGFLVKSGRKIPYYFTGRRTTIDGQFYLVGLGVDITERRKLEQELVRQAKTDPLTGVSNRRHFIEMAEQEILRARRYGKPLSVLMLDLDEFKLINDRYGHQAGDGVLCKVCDIYRLTLRVVDIVGRMGGEEFAILLPETNAEKAVEVAERLRQDIAHTAIPMGGDEVLHITASIGICTLGPEGDDIDVLLNRADQAMYQVKRSGRNRVEVAHSR